MSQAFSNSFFLEWSPDGYSAAQAQGQPVSAVALDGYGVTASFTTAPVFVKSLDAFSIQVSDVGGASPNGSFTVQACNDMGKQSSQAQPDVTLQNWVTLTFTNEQTGARVSSFPLAGAGSSVLVQEFNCTYRWLRIAWTNTSGSAKLSVRLQQKGVS